MILPRGIVIPLALLVAAFTVVLAFGSGIERMPTSFFAGDATLVLAPASGALPSEGGVPVELVAPLRGMHGVDAVSPETYALTSVRGHSILVRGVDFDPFIRIEHLVLRSGRVPVDVDEALVGVAASQALPAAVGDRLLLPSSLVRAGVPITIVGVFDTSSAARDEILVPLAASTGLTNLASSEVHIIRIAASDPANVSAIVGSFAPSYSYSDVRLSTLTALPGEAITMTANLTNWGQVEGVKNVIVHNGNTILAERAYNVPARTTVHVSVNFVIGDAGATNVSINPTFLVDVRTPPLRFVGMPPAAVAGRPLEVQLATQDGETVTPSGVDIILDNATATTDASGHARVMVWTAGDRQLMARAANGSTLAIAPLFVAATDADAGPVLAVEVILPPALPVGVALPARFEFHVRNVGAIAGAADVGVRVDGVERGRISVNLPPGVRATLPFDLPLLAAGNHTVGSTASAQIVDLRVYPGSDPRVAALLESYQTPPAPKPLTPENAGAYVNSLLGDITKAIVAVSIASGVLVALGAVAVLARHVAERASVLGMLKSIGATDDRVLWMTTRDGALVAGIALGVGIPAGFAMAIAADHFAILRGFGHAVHPAFDPQRLLAFGVCAIVFVSLAARALVAGALTRPPDELLGGKLLRPLPESARELGSWWEASR